MNNHFSRIGIICSSIHFFLFLVALILTIFFVEDSPLIAIYLFILAFPWSFIWGFVIVIFYLGLGIYDPSTNVSVIVISFLSVINTVIIYKICKKYEKRKIYPE